VDDEDDQPCNERALFLHFQANATTPGIPAEPDDDTFHTLGALHGPLPREIPAQPATTAVQVDLATLRSVISRLRSGVAPGPSGLTNDLIKQLFPTSSEEDTENLVHLLAFVNAVLAGNVTEATMDWLGASNLVALYKLDPAGNLKRRCVDGRPDIRPIAVPETLYRICALCALRALKGKIVGLLRETQQLGVGVPAACESIATLVRLYLEDPEADDAYCVMIDFANAFNSICRASVLEAVAVHVPELLPFARASYSRPGRLVYRYRGKGPPRHRVFCVVSQRRPPGRPARPGSVRLGLHGCHAQGAG
jgi:hypothetical protein